MGVIEKLLAAAKGLTEDKDGLETVEGIRELVSAIKSDAPASQIVDPEVAAAFAAAQAEFTLVRMNKKAIARGGREYPYADLAAIFEATKPALNKHGLSVFHQIGIEYGNGTRVTATPILLHKTGKFLRGEPCTIICADGTPHSVGSGITYSKRYSLSSILGVAADEDDDAGSAMPDQKTPGPRKEEKAEPPKPAPRSRGRKAATDPGLEQFVNGSLNPKYQTMNGLLSEGQINELQTAVSKAKIDPGKFILWVSKKYGPVKKSFDLKKEWFDEIMLILKDKPDIISKEPAGSDDVATELVAAENGAETISKDDLDRLKDAFETAGISRQDATAWLTEYTKTLGDEIDMLMDIHKAWLPEIIDSILADPESIKGYATK